MVDRDVCEMCVCVLRVCVYVCVCVCVRVRVRVRVRVPIHTSTNQAELLGGWVAVWVCVRMCAKAGGWASSGMLSGGMLSGTINLISGDLGQKSGTRDVDVDDNRTTTGRHLRPSQFG